MRLFIAVNFCDEFKSGLCTVISALRLQTEHGNFSRRENLHLTLAFLGETEHADKAKAAMDQVDAEPFILTAEGFGTFHSGEGEIYWVGVRNNAVLNSLNGQLCRALQAADFQLETRPFSPHLTLGRKVVMKPGFDRRSFERNIPVMNMPVDKISLMKSERIGGRLTYTEIYAKTLGKKQ